MKIKTIFSQVLAIATVTIFLLSCEKDDPLTEKEGYARGVYISCEGTFNANNGSISWYLPDSAKIENNLFEKINGRPAGDVVQSFAVAGDYGVIVANNSQKIEIIDMESFESVNTLTGFSYPRFFVYSGNGSGYLSNGSLDGQVYKIELQTGTVLDSIEVGMGPEQMVIAGNHLFVANSGGWGYDNTVSVIDITSDEVLENITVGDIPVAVKSDRAGNIWVLCRGKVVYNDTWTEIIEETNSRLVRIDPSTMAVDKEIVTGIKGDGFNPSWFTVSPDGETLFFGEADGLYSMSIDENVQPAEPVIEKIFSSAGIDPLSGRLLALEIIDYSSPGLLHIYNGNDLESTSETGIAPGGIVFSDEQQR
ncbi:MAG: YncE family protein [bacterium]